MGDGKLLELGEGLSSSGRPTARKPLWRVRGRESEEAGATEETPSQAWGRHPPRGPRTLTAQRPFAHSSAREHGPGTERAGETLVFRGGSGV